MPNKKFDGRIVITRKSVKGQGSQAAKTARFDMQQEGIKPLTEEEALDLDRLYKFEPDKEPWWNR